MAAAHKPLIRYEAACRALAEAKAVDEAHKIRNVSEAMRAYAHQAKNKQLEIDAAEIRIRAERRIGELMAAQKEAGLMASGGQPHQKNPTGSKKNPVAPITLAEVGIDKSLADRARKYAAVPEEEWEEELQDWRERVSAENKRVTTRLERRGESEIRRVNDCSIPESAIVSTKLVCPHCGQEWPEGRPIHG